jgi:hypothetical protein
LRELKSFTLHKPARLRFKRRPIICSTIDMMWGMDVIIYHGDKNINNGYSNILLTVDCFSKMVAVEKLKGRTAKDMVEALGNIFKRTKRKPLQIFADQDKAFTAKIFKAFLAKNSVHMYHSVSWLHSSLSERYLGTFKRIMGRIFTFRNSHKWIDVYLDVAASMNNSYNRAIQMKSVEVNKHNQSTVWHNLYSKYFNVKKARAWYRVGDLVKISTRTLKDVFVKSYNASWGLETYKIKSIHTGISVPFYTLSDLNGEDIQGMYYNEDLQLVSRPENSDD